MIDRTEILAVATDLSLSADVVEKDYVLGWLLAGIYAHPELGPTWIFKGGTCLKKCYFETYRFSEDLDFTVTAEAQLDADGLARCLGEVSAWIYERTGIELPADQIRLEVYRNKRQGLSCEGRLYYNGPLRRVSSLPRIKLDLTADEVLVLPPVERPVIHLYSDLPEGSTAISPKAGSSRAAMPMRKCLLRRRGRSRSGPVRAISTMSSTFSATASFSRWQRRSSTYSGGNVPSRRSRCRPLRVSAGRLRN
jgi:hypothetical protein